MLSLRVLIRVIVPLCSVIPAAHAGSVKPAVAKARETLASLPVRFEPNAGQWAPEVRYAARAGGYSVALTSREAVVSLAPDDGKPARRIGIALEGAAALPDSEGLEPLPARGSYLLGNRRSEWRTGVPQYGRVRYREVYPGIDVVYYANGRQLEYDFVLQPGADPARIRMRFRGADRVSVTKSGDLLLRAGERSVTQKRPVVFQEDADGTRRPVEARYRVSGNAARIEVADYDRSRPLTIDPVLQYSSLFGGERGDAVTGVSIDAEGFVWVAGYVTSGDIPARGGEFSGEFKAGSDLFVAKIDPNASGNDSLVYFTYIGGNGADVTTGMAMDAEGSVYLTGWTNSTDFPLGGYSYQTSRKESSTDAFVLKLRPAVAGEYALAYSSYLGGNGTDEGRGVDVDAAGKIYIVGTTTSENFPAVSARQSTRWGEQDAFVAKFDPDALDGTASLAFSTLIGGNGFDDGRAIAVRPDGIAYIAGSTSSTEFPWAGVPYQDTYQGGADVFIAKVDATKSGEDSVPYASYFGGTGLDEARRVALDADGKLWITGVTLSQDLPASATAFQGSRPGGDGDGFIARLNVEAGRDSAVEYLSYLGGSGGDVAYDVTADPTGGVWVTGYTLSRDFPVTQDALSAAYPGGVNVFATKIDPAAENGTSLVYSTYLGQINIHVGYAIAAGPNGKVAIGGVTSNPAMRTTENAARNQYAGGTSDGFVVVLSGESPAPVTQ